MSFDFCTSQDSVDSDISFSSADCYGFFTTEKSDEIDLLVNAAGKPAMLLLCLGLLVLFAGISVSFFNFQMGSIIGPFGLILLFLSGRVNN